MNDSNKAQIIMWVGIILTIIVSTTCIIWYDDNVHRRVKEDNEFKYKLNQK